VHAGKLIRSEIVSFDRRIKYWRKCWVSRKCRNSGAARIWCTAWRHVLVVRRHVELYNGGEKNLLEILIGN